EPQQRPQHRATKRAPGEPPGADRSGHCQRRGDEREEVGKKAPGRGLRAFHQERGDEAAEQCQHRKEGTVQQGQREGGKGDQRQQREGEQRRQQGIKGIGGIEAAEGRGKASGGQRRRQVVRADGGG